MNSDPLQMEGKHRRSGVDRRALNRLRIVAGYEHHAAAGPCADSLPAERPGIAYGRLDLTHGIGLHALVQNHLALPVAGNQVSDVLEVAVGQRLRHAPGEIFHFAEGSNDPVYAIGVGVHDPGYGITGNAGFPQVAQNQVVLESGPDLRWNGNRRGVDPFSRKTQEVDTAEGRGELILAASGQATMVDLELPPEPGGLLREDVVALQSIAGEGQRGSERARSPQARAQGCVGTSTQLDTSFRNELYHRGLEQSQHAGGGQVSHGSDFHRLVEILGVKEYAGGAASGFYVDVPVDRGVDDQAAFPADKGRHIGPTSGEIQADRRFDTNGRGRRMRRPYDRGHVITHDSTRCS